MVLVKLFRKKWLIDKNKRCKSRLKICSNFLQRKMKKKWYWPSEQIPFDTFPFFSL